jgi:hypothetical protein
MDVQAGRSNSVKLFLNLGFLLLRGFVWVRAVVDCRFVDAGQAIGPKPARELWLTRWVSS